MVVWGGLTNSQEKKRSERQRRKGKLYPFECRVQRVARRDKKAFLSDQWKEIEENNRMRKTRATELNWQSLRFGGRGKTLAPPYNWVLFSHSVVSHSLWPHRLQHTRLPYPSPSSGACLNISPPNRWFHPTISSSVILLLLPSIFPSIRLFSNELALCIRWPKYWSFSISHSNEYSGLISFRMDWFDLLAVRGELGSPSYLTIHYSWYMLLGMEKQKFSNILPPSTPFYDTSMYQSRSVQENIVYATVN